MIDMKAVKSSSIGKVGYDPKKQELHVNFKNGNQHVYAGVTAETHSALLSAKSVGAHFSENIRNNYPSRKK